MFEGSINYIYIIQVNQVDILLVVDNYFSPSGKNTSYLTQQMHYENDVETSKVSWACWIQYIRKINEE